jgi:leader peptidase (prepilin peptidase)/N-methyltransferase
MRYGVPVEWPVVVVAGVLGAMLGSFLNVCILRLPENQSIVRPRSRCPKCRVLIAWYDNIPIVSWLFLRGKCRHCGERISIQYPLIEAAAAAIWLAAFVHYGFGWTGLAAAVFGTLLLGIGVTDARTYVIPDEFTIGGLVIGLGLSLARGVDGLLTAAIGAAVGFFLMLFVAWAGEKAFKKEAMGGGDIKMMAMVGAFVGWKGVLLTIFGGALLGTIIFVPLTLGKKRLVPFGVFLAGAAALSFVLGDQMVDWYLRMALGQ